MAAPAALLLILGIGPVHAHEHEPPEVRIVTTDGSSQRGVLQSYCWNYGLFTRECGDYGARAERALKTTAISVTIELDTINRPEELKMTAISPRRGPVRTAAVEASPQLDAAGGSLRWTGELQLPRRAGRYLLVVDGTWRDEVSPTIDQEATWLFSVSREPNG